MVGVFTLKMFTGILTLIPFYLIMFNLGLIDTYIGAILAFSTHTIPLALWIIKGYIDSIPKELDESAMIMGNSRFRVLRKIVLPLSGPAIAITFLLNFLSTWNGFLMAFVLLQSPGKYTLPIKLYTFLGSIESSSPEWGLFAAASILVTIPLLLVFVFLRNYLLKGIDNSVNIRDVWNESWNKKPNKKIWQKNSPHDINVTIPEGSFTVILGPSGSGKTTLLRILAGLLYPSEGQIFFNEKNITDIPANKRNIAMVFQNYPLFPHMTVEENLRFPLESQKEGNLFKRRTFSSSDVQNKVDETLKLFKLEEHRNKYPSQLSGGEQQRVAIGREVIRQPVIFLFDEPLSNIDARLRYEMRTWIRKLHGILKTTMVYVTHDQAEALSLGDTIILLQDGKIAQMGPPEELYDEPNQKFVAQFIGNFPMNFLKFKSSKNTVSLVIDKQILLPKNLQKRILKENITEFNSKG